MKGHFLNTSLLNNYTFLFKSENDFYSSKVNDLFDCAVLVPDLPTLSKIKQLCTGVNRIKLQ